MRNLIWKRSVPPKVQNFTWRLSTDSFPTQRNKHKCKLELTDQCPVCGIEPEDNFHPFIRRPLARSLWSHMAVEWQLPAPEGFQNAGKEWLLNAIGNLPKRIIDKVWSLLEIKLGNRQFTWANNQVDLIMSTIDRVFCTTDIDRLFPLASIQALHRLGSDHTPIFWDSGIGMAPRSSSYKFEKWWLLKEEFN